MVGFIARVKIERYMKCNIFGSIKRKKGCPLYVGISGRGLVWYDLDSETINYFNGNVSSLITVPFRLPCMQKINLRILHIASKSM